MSACNGRTGPGQWFDDGVGQELGMKLAVALAVGCANPVALTLAWGWLIGLA